MSGEQGRTIWCLVKGDLVAIPVGVIESANINHLKEAIREKCNIRVTSNRMVLWKLINPELLNPEKSLADRIKLRGDNFEEFAVRLDSGEKVSEHFPISLEIPHVQVIAQIVPESNGEAKKKHSSFDARRWTLNEAISPKSNEVNERYYVDPGTQNVTSLCLNAISEGTYLLLAGARASGKTTRLMWLRRKLEAMGYWVLYITFESLVYWGSREDFWKSFGMAIDRAVARYGHGLPQGPTTPISSPADLAHYFRKDAWNGNVVFLLDELSSLHKGQDDVQDSFLQAFRGLKHDRETHAVQCFIAAGTFNIIYLTTSAASPFNVTDFVQSPYFTIDEIRKLFSEFAEDVGISIDDAIVEDVWAKSNGNLKTLLCLQSQTISYHRWQRFSAEELYGEIALYNPFHSMIQSLSRPETSSAVDLLRSRFAGFLGEVILTDKKAKEDADTLTSEGVLVKPKPATACYRMASPLVDGLIRNQLIPAIFPNAPSSPLPRQHTGHVGVLRILIESLKFFDKALILSSSSFSYKTPKVKIPLSHGPHVPRESVYDTELMRVLANWLRKYDWSVNGQWHLEDNLKRPYSDIVFEKDSQRIVLELLATGEPSSVESHIRKTPGYAALLSANEAWVVHFTCQEDYCPIWQSDAELSKSINVVHFAHDPGFTNVVMSARWKDGAGEVHQEVRKSLPLD
ncbi:hypothetical protein F5887DRAFT_1069378 [Amanita rubescens]|nr:hypothetical protein F5887DRAFT_1069378 [Amanita rubescens]